MIERIVTAGVFVVGLLFLLLLELGSRRRGDDSRSLAGVLARLSLRRTSRIAMILFWWWIGWHFLCAT